MGGSVAVRKGLRDGKEGGGGRRGDGWERRLMSTFLNADPNVHQGVQPCQTRTDQETAFGGEMDIKSGHPSARSEVR